MRTLLDVAASVVALGVLALAVVSLAEAAHPRQWRDPVAWAFALIFAGVGAAAVLLLLGVWFP